MTDSPLVLGPMLRYVDETSAAVWVETRDTATVVVGAVGRSWSARTFAVHGHHYALVYVDGLTPGSVAEYSVTVNGVGAWPHPGSGFPASVIATLDAGRQLRMSFGSCRTSVPHDKTGTRTHGVDALRAFAFQLSADDSVRPDLLLFLGDQVYADSTSAAMKEFIESRRDIKQPPGAELADYEEYAHLYNLAWSDEANRWLMSTVPTAMIFDDHDIRDDWNASVSWKRDMERKPWWQGRIVAGLASYWVYQHLGNLSPAERAVDPMWRLIASHHDEAELDLSDAIDVFADRADKEPTSYRWSYCRDISDVRVIMLDSRAARELDPEHRSIVDAEEMEWLDATLTGGFRHVLLGSSLPFLLPTGLHHLEAWNEAISQGAWGRVPAWLGERLRRGLDLEHWAAFQNSFRQVAGMLTEVADGKRGAAPQTVTILSGDVHFSYVSEVDRSTGSRIIQAVCSPIRNPLARWLRSFTALVSYGIAAGLSGRLSRAAGVQAPPFAWSGLKGPWFDNCLAVLTDTPGGLQLRWMSGVESSKDDGQPGVKDVVAVTVLPRSR
ncbi:MAG TPA: alkaline phosphatase D family protein [Glaciibacter sp.]|nr:alkaline phosphatase D family protein [Glaciibacter sp.]